MTKHSIDVSKLTKLNLGDYRPVKGYQPICIGSRYTTTWCDKPGKMTWILKDVNYEKRLALLEASCKRKDGTYSLSSEYDYSGRKQFWTQLDSLVWLKTANNYTRLRFIVTDLIEEQFKNTIVEGDELNLIYPYNNDHRQCRINDYEFKRSQKYIWYKHVSDDEYVLRFDIDHYDLRVFLKDLKTIGIVVGNEYYFILNRFIRSSGLKKKKYERFDIFTY